MGEELTEKIERLEFSTVAPGDVIHITTGIDDEAWIYDFTVSDTSTARPNGTLKATMPDGTEVGSISFALHGCGRWTDRRQNPVQSQDRAFTPYYEGLITGSFLWGKSSVSAERWVFDKPGQEISKITITKS
jgi:hypothetical protein